MSRATTNASTPPPLVTPDRHIPLSIRLVEVIMGLELIVLLVASVGVSSLIIFVGLLSKEPTSQIPQLVAFLIGAVAIGVVPLVLLIGIHRLSRVIWVLCVVGYSAVAVAGIVVVTLFSSQLGGRLSTPELYLVALAIPGIIPVLLLLPQSRHAVFVPREPTKDPLSSYAKRRRSRRSTNEKTQTP